MRSRRLVHYLALAAVHGLLTLPNLGATSLWDMDEGVNAECAREMNDGRVYTDHKIEMCDGRGRVGKAVKFRSNINDVLMACSQTACGRTFLQRKEPNARNTQ